MNKPRFKVGDQVIVKKGVQRGIDEEKISRAYNYIGSRMDAYARQEKVLTICCIYEGNPKKPPGYKVDECESNFTYNEEWLLPAHVTNEELLYMLQKKL